MAIRAAPEIFLQLGWPVLALAAWQLWGRSRNRFLGLLTLALTGQSVRVLLLGARTEIWLAAFRGQELGPATAQPWWSAWDSLSGLLMAAMLPIYWWGVALALLACAPAARWLRTLVVAAAVGLTVYHLGVLGTGILMRQPDGPAPIPQLVIALLPWVQCVFWAVVGLVAWQARRQGPGAVAAWLAAVAVASGLGAVAGWGWSALFTVAAVATWAGALGAAGRLTPGR